ncbi:MAG: hypothetical protein U9R79_08870 [Armatimonadota bacterium]|nr:hypothetical protein [Armatimonadota bacterium]
MTGKPVRLVIAASLILATAMACQAQDVAAPEVENLVANPGFEQPDLEGWSRVLAGDDEGVIEPSDDAHTGSGSARVHAPTDRAWSFLRQQDFDVAIGETLVLSAWVKSSSTRAKLVLTGGFLWGGAPSGHQTTADRHSGSGKWELLRVELAIEQLPISAAIGFDYNSPGATLLVDDVRLAREADVLAEDAVECAHAFKQLAGREDLPGWIRDGLQDRAERGAELVMRYRETAHDAEGFAEVLDALRDYVAARRQLITWEAGSAPEGEAGPVPLVLERIRLEAERGDDAVTTISLLNAFGQHSVAVRVVPRNIVVPLDEQPTPAGEADVSEEPSLRTQVQPQVVLEAGRIRVMELIPRGGAMMAVDPGEDLAVWAPVNEPRQVRVVFPTHDLAPGAYTGTLLLQPLDRTQAGPPQEVAVELAVR